MLKSKLHRKVILSLILFSTILAIQSSVQAFKIEYGPFGSPIHEEITQQGLSFLNENVTNAIVEGNRSVDVGVIESEIAGELSEVEPTSFDQDHFDNCQFEISVQNINRQYDNIISRINPNGTTDFDYITQEFGQLLHTVQDFYAHSNWIELSVEGYVTGLIEPSINDKWTLLSPPSVSDSRRLVNGVMILQGTPAYFSDLGLTLEQDGSIIRVKDTITGEFIAPGLITGTHEGIPGDNCAVDISHGDPTYFGPFGDGWEEGNLNKDKPRAEQGILHYLARSAATKQTRNEFCRLLSLAENAFPGQGRDLLMNNLVENAQAVNNICSQTVDLVFVIDNTSSMSNDIARVKNEAVNHVNQLVESGRDYRMALVTFRDHDRAYTTVASTDLNFSTNPEEIVDAIQSIVLPPGGATFPEAVYSGLMQAINLNWRPTAQKVIILMTDDVPHDPEPVTGYTKRSVEIAAANLGIGIDETTGLVPGSLNPDIIVIPPAEYSTYSSENRTSLSAKIFPLLISNNAQAKQIYGDLAENTDGQSFNISNANELTNVLNGILDIVVIDPLERINPKTAQTVTNVLFNLRWGQDTSANWYELWIVGENGYVFNQWYPALNSDGAPYGQTGVCDGLLCRVDAPPMPNGNYEWWLNTWNSVDGMGFWDGSTFNLEIEAPSEPRMIRPFSGGDVDSSDEMLTWRYDPNAMWFDVWLVHEGGTYANNWYPAEDWGDFKGICDEVTEVCSAPLTGTVLPNGEVTWWLGAWNHAGISSYADRRFDLAIGIPDRISTYFPEIGAHVVLRWQNDTEALNYHIYLADNLGNVVIDEYVDATESCVENLCSYYAIGLENGSYDWYIAGQGSNGMGPYNNSPIDFQVDLAAPETVSITTPVENATITSVPAIVSWQEQSTAAWYQVLVKAGDEEVTNQWFDSRTICSNGACSAQLEIIGSGIATLEVTAWGPGGMSTPSTVSITLNTE